MNSIINQIYGKAVQEKQYTFPAGAPLYIKRGFQASILTWDGKECLLVKPVQDNLTLPTIKRQVKTIEAVCEMPVIVDLKRITSLQRTNLIQSGIPFVSGTGQLFVPFWGGYFEEKIRNQAIAPKKMTANAQLVFLYLCYHYINETVINLTALSKLVNLPKSTCSRAVQSLEALNLVSAVERGPEKLIALREAPARSLSTGWQYLTTPIQREVYVSKNPSEVCQKISGIRALAEISMLIAKDNDGAIAVSRKESGHIPQDLFIDRQTFLDFGGIVVEVWKYDPFILSDDICVDDISLLLSLQDNRDERVQNELDNIREKYELGESTWQQE